jgi:hypothetical protein
MHNSDFNLIDVFVFSTLTDGPIYVATFPVYVFNCLLILLLVLHVIWTYMLLRAVHKYVVVGQVGKLVVGQVG